MDNYIDVGHAYSCQLTSPGFTSGANYQEPRSLAFPTTTRIQEILSNSSSRKLLLNRRQYGELTSCSPWKLKGMGC